MRKVAITGGLSSGKSTVCRILKDLGAYTVSADEIVHTLLDHDTALQKKIIEAFGSDILTNNRLDREKIAKLVFSDPNKLQQLENLIHPAVFHEIKLQYEKHKTSKDFTVFVAEVPLLYETKSEKLFDTVITVLADSHLCKKRFSQIKNQSEAEFEHRMLFQLSPDQKATKADFVLINNGSEDDLKEQISNLLPKIRSI